MKMIKYSSTSRKIAQRVSPLWDHKFLTLDSILKKLKALWIFCSGLKILGFLYRVVPVQVRPGAPTNNDFKHLLGKIILKKLNSIQAVWFKIPHIAVCVGTTMGPNLSNVVQTSFEGSSAVSQ